MEMSSAKVKVYLNQGGGGIVLISVKDLHAFWKVRPRGVVHVGAHAAEELVDYETYGFGPIFWVEAQPSLAAKLMNRISPPSQVIQALVWDTSDEELSLKLTNNSQSSSIFDFGSHKVDHPEVLVVGEITLRTRRLDEILPKSFTHNFLNIDIQGAEYQALKGLGGLLDNFDYVYLEVNRKHVYIGIALISDIDQLLNQEGFVRVATFWTLASWGDAFYIKRALAEKTVGRNFVLALKIFTFKLILLWKKIVMIWSGLRGLVRRKRNAVNPSKAQ
jgi:FkbM family methyltransferase